MRDKWLGWGGLPGKWPIRRAREWAEFVGMMSKEIGKKAWWFIPLAMILEYFKQLGHQSEAQFAGK